MTVKEIFSRIRAVKRVFLIEQVYLDCMENEIGSAVKFIPYGFVLTEEEAKAFCDKGKVYTNDDCWAVYKELKEYRYKEIKRA